MVFDVLEKKAQLSMFDTFIVVTCVYKWFSLEVVELKLRVCVVGTKVC